MFVALGEAVDWKDEPPSEFDVSALRCRRVESPEKSFNGFYCDLTYRNGRGERSELSLRDSGSSSRAERLLAALHAAGARTWSNKGASGIRLSSLKVRTNTLSFDEETDSPPGAPPNVHVDGGAARAILDAMSGGGVNDDDGSLHVYCQSSAARPSCIHAVHGGPATTLDEAQSGALWNALMEALGPLRTTTNDAATLDRAGRLYASSFTYDGSALRFFVLLAPEP